MLSSALRIVTKVLLVTFVVFHHVAHNWRGLLKSELEEMNHFNERLSSRALHNTITDGTEFTRIQNITLTTQPFIPRRTDRATTTVVAPPPVINDDEFHMPFVHIVKTRFMQTQAPLVALGRARLELFKSFCLPSIVNQTSQNFVWIIKADPDLTEDLLSELLTLLSPYPNVYLIADNEKFDPWAAGGEATNQLFQTKIYTGNQALLEDAIYHATHGRNKVPILETRLDADDALHVEYFERVQELAMKRLGGGGSRRRLGGVDSTNRNNNKVKWTWWGIHDVMEWHWIGQGHGQGQGKQEQEEYGVLHPRTYKRSAFYVPTPGLTLGVAAGAKAPKLTNHAKLKHHVKNLPVDQGCGLKNNEDCIQYVAYRSSYPALRTRCPTSASMMDIDSFTKKQLEENYMVSGKYWMTLTNGFRIDPEQAKSTFHHLTTNLGAIAYDAILGQCTASHSCRPEAKDQLERLLNSIKTK